MLPPRAALNANFAEAHCNLGNILKEQGKFDEAAACYQRALVLRPAYVNALNNLGNTLKDQGKLDEAIACHRRALELKPDYAEVYGNLGLALEDQGKLDEAIACHRRALELKPDYAGAHYNLGSTLEKVGDFQGAVASLRAALRVDGRFAFAHAKLAELLGGKLPDEDLAAQRLARGNRPHGSATIVAALRTGPSDGRAGRICQGRRAPAAGQRPATGRLARRGRSTIPKNMNAASR